jgi:hypothetical protein
MFRTSGQTLYSTSLLTTPLAVIEALTFVAQKGSPFVSGRKIAVYEHRPDLHHVNMYVN